MHLVLYFGNNWLLERDRPDNVHPKSSYDGSHQHARGKGDPPYL